MDKKTQQRVPLRMLGNPIHLLAFGLGSGLAPKMPGTIGTIAGLALYIGLAPAEDWRVYLAIVVVGFLLGVFICSYTSKALQVHDHGGIVWDEIVGYWITMFLVPKTLFWALLGFCLFRLFDIWKPWPISVADKKVHGGLGIMLDDVIAGLFSLLIIQIILYLL